MTVCGLQVIVISYAQYHSAKIIWISHVFYGYWRYANQISAPYDMFSMPKLSFVLNDLAHQI